MGMVYWGLISKFSYHNIVFLFSVLYGLLALNLALYDFFPAKPAPFMIALSYIVSIAWQAFIPILIWTGVNRFLDVKRGMRLYPILIVLMGVGFNLGQLPSLLLRTYFDVVAYDFKWAGVVALFCFAFLLKKFSSLPEIQKRGMDSPYLVFPRFVFGIFVFILAFIYMLPKIWSWCIK